jgi:multiple sugar transport system permease protein
MGEKICTKKDNKVLKERIKHIFPKNIKTETTIGLKISGNLKHKTYRIATYILLLDMTFVFAFPFLYMLVTSIKNNKDLYDFTVSWIPRSFELKNYVIAFKILEYQKFFLNSFIVTIFASIGHLLSCSFIGYGFARYEFRGKKLLFSLVILGSIIPVQTIIVPMYITFANLKWLNTFLPIIIPSFFGYGLKGGLFVFIFRQFYLGLPISLEDAAKIDGCGYLKTYWNIVLPIAKSAIIVVIVLSIVWHWNDFYEPSIYCYVPKLTMLPSRLYHIVDMVKTATIQQFEISSVGEAEIETVINNAVLMAGTFLVILPVLISFGFLQRQFMQGIERTGLVE